jgi:hypothetical protein
MSKTFKSFVSATGHYIDNNWILQEVIIDFNTLSGKHDGLNITNGFYKILEEFNIMEKVFFNNFIFLILKLLNIFF